MRDPERKKETYRLWRQRNLVKVRADFARWKEENPDKVRDGQLRVKYGISLEQYEAMLEGQEGRCAICMHTAPGGRGAFHVDHCHLTGKVRGLLCSTCNTGLGHFRDSLVNLRLAQRYLEAHASPC